MTQATETRQIRLLIDDILGAYGIDNLEISIKITDGIKRILQSSTPAKAREDYLQSIKKSMEAGITMSQKLDEIRGEIHRRIKINPIGEEWEEFLRYAYNQEKEGKTIARFLDWWLSDEWQAGHPPSKPTIWRIKWDLAFANSRPVRTDDSADFNPMESY